MLNKADRKKNIGLAASDNDKKILDQVAKLMERSRSNAIMTLAKQYLEKYAGIALLC